jgi:hypothetical protein
LWEIVTSTRVITVGAGVEVSKTDVSFHLLWEVVCGLADNRDEGVISGDVLA